MEVAKNKLNKLDGDIKIGLTNSSKRPEFRLDVNCDKTPNRIKAITNSKYSKLII